MIFGDQITVRRFTTSMFGQETELVSTSETVEAIAQLKQQEFDLAVVDSSAEQAERVCRCVQEIACVPLVLMVRNKRADWRKLQWYEPDGYLPKEAGEGELCARLRSIIRCF